MWTRIAALSGWQIRKKKADGWLRFAEVLVILKFAETLSNRRRVGGGSSRKGDRKPCADFFGTAAYRIVGQTEWCSRRDQIRTRYPKELASTDNTSNIPAESCV